jgi:hypothetical protein
MLIQAKALNASYISRILRLTGLALDIVVSILDGTHAPHLTLAMLMEPFPIGWQEQQQAVNRPGCVRGPFGERRAEAREVDLEAGVSLFPLPT